MNIPGTVDSPDQGSIFKRQNYFKAYRMLEGFGPLNHLRVEKVEKIGSSILSAYPAYLLGFPLAMGDGIKLEILTRMGREEKRNRFHTG